MKLPPNKTHVQVIADYLRRFHDYVYEELLKTFLLKDYRQHQYRYVGTYIYKEHSIIRNIRRNNMITCKKVPYSTCNLVR